MNDMTFKTKTLALAAGLLLTASTGWAQMNHSCAKDPVELIERGVVFVVKTEVNAKKMSTDTPQQNKAEYDDYQCLLSVVLENTEAEENFSIPVVKTQMVAAVQTQLEEQKISTTTNATLAARFGNDAAMISHIVNFALEAHDSYLSFWYQEFYDQEDELDLTQICSVEQKTYVQLNGIRDIPLVTEAKRRESLNAINSDLCLSAILNTELKLQLVDDLLSYENHAKRSEDIVLDFLGGL